MREAIAFLAAGFALAFMLDRLGVSPETTTLLFASAIPVSAVLHEALHYLAARLAGVKLSRLVVDLRGGRLGFYAERFTRRGLIITALAPQALTLTALVAALAYSWLPGLAVALVNLAGSVSDFRLVHSLYRGTA